MRLPLFNLFEYPKHPQLYDALRAAGPERAWTLMSDLDRLFSPIYQEEVKEFTATTRAKVIKFMNMVPALSGADKSSYADQAAGYGPKLMFESTFITLWLDNPGLLFKEVVEVVGAEELRAAQELGHGVLALPLHLGPSYTIGPLISHSMPTRLVFNRMNFDEIKQAAFPNLPIEGFQLGSVSAFRAGLAAMRSGMAFSIFPELDPRGVDAHHVPVEFLGVRIFAPLGPVIMSQAAQAPMVPVVLSSLGGGKFRLVYHPMIEAPSKGASPTDALVRLWAIIESELITGQTGEWEMWHEFDRMLPSSEEDLA
ncbi:MAG: hypothetical protein B5766_03550 [Candidatus Lumbricidophila eiseniae]|uniref:Lipid A biosynthesis acyltransferase n=1 Tax=Candidatus Lumbricidiphila eiseniae TaxID=1969409 RepID=A0A2A6FSN8_9MICO|nr:MAG: hypothetical protein B5766_03550 [Candidatus Lumbricidophila eiseniae]